MLLASGEPGSSSPCLSSTTAPTVTGSSRWVARCHFIFYPPRPGLIIWETHADRQITAESLCLPSTLVPAYHLLLGREGLDQKDPHGSDGHGPDEGARG